MPIESTIELFEYNSRTKKEKKLFKGWWVELIEPVDMNKILLLEPHNNALKVVIEKR